MHSTSSPAAFQGQALSHLRHNLRTPVNHILGYSEMLIEDAEESGCGELLGELRGIHDDGRQVLLSINAALGAAENVDTETLLALRADLSPPIGRLLGRARAITGDMTAAGINASDIAKVQSAGEQLLAMLEAAVGGSVAPLAPAPAASPRPADPAPRSARGHILVVDDNDGNRDVLSKRLEREGYTIATAVDGREALERLAAERFDLVLLDIMMPEIDGFQVLQRIKADPALSDTAVIMISALDEIQSVVRCISSGAEDYLTKPFDPVLLRARIGACLERKRLLDEQKRKNAALESAVREAERERQVSESLLASILPATIARELRERGAVDPRYYEDVTILFSDFAGFTLATENLAAEDLVWVLNNYFTEFDRITGRYGLEKLKTIGDSYMLAGGLPDRSPSHPVDVVLAAFEMIEAVRRLESADTPWKVRIGIHTGPVIAGLVGTRKFAFDIWGESVNFASRMESTSSHNEINISARTQSRVKDFFLCESRGRIATKEQKEFEMYFVRGLQPKLLAGADASPPPAFLRRYGIYFQKQPPAFPDFLLA